MSDEEYNSFTYGLRYPSRTLAALPNLPDGEHAWVTGTCRPQELNEIRIVQFQEENAEDYFHPDYQGTGGCKITQHGAVTHLDATAFGDGHHIAVCHQIVKPADQVPDSTGYRLKILQISNDSNLKDNQSVEPPVAFEDVTDDVEKCSYSAPITGKDVKMAILRQHLTLDILDGEYKKMTSFPVRDAHDILTNMAVKTDLRWDANNVHCVGIACGSKASIWDSRHPSNSIYAVETHPHFHILSLSFNPNRPNQIVTGTEDGKLRFWDLRKPQKPILESGQLHGHWVTTVQYNPFHDQLVLSGSTDGTVGLMNMHSVSSSARFSNGQDREIPTVPDVHQGGVYECVWSSGDPWTWAGVSYDGNVVVQRVPSAEKYAILLADS